MFSLLPYFYGQKLKRHSVLIRTFYIEHLSKFKINRSSTIQMSLSPIMFILHHKQVILKAQFTQYTQIKFVNNIGNQLKLTQLLGQTCSISAECMTFQHLVLKSFLRDCEVIFKFRPYIDSKLILFLKFLKFRRRFAIKF